MDILFSTTLYSNSIVILSPFDKGILSWYLDPGSGSFILQVLLATLLASLLFLKTYWRKIIGFFKKPPSQNQDPSQNGEDSDVEGK
jgi:hypothetical protein